MPVFGRGNICSTQHSSSWHELSGAGIDAIHIGFLVTCVDQVLSRVPFVGLRACLPVVSGLKTTVHLCSSYEVPLFYR